MLKRRHSGAPALPASPESRNTCFRSQWVGRCSWIPGPAPKGCPGTTAEFFRNLLVAKRVSGGLFIHFRSRNQSLITWAPAACCDGAPLDLIGKRSVGAILENRLLG